MYMQGKNIVFTGGTSGLGKVAAFDAANSGAHVYLMSRRASAELEEEFRAKFPTAKGSLTTIQGDLADLASIAAFCRSVAEHCDHVDVLVNNAGLWSFAFQETRDKIEETFQVNLLAPYLLIRDLKPLLRKASQPLVINTASALHQGFLDFDDIEYRGKFSGFQAYRQSKLGLVLLTRWLAQNDKSVTYVSHHPGLVSTGLVRSGGWFSRTFFSSFGMSEEKGAETLIFLLRQTPTDLKSGEYYTKSALKKTSTPESYNLHTAGKLMALLDEYAKRVPAV